MKLELIPVVHMNIETNALFVDANMGRGILCVISYKL